MIFLNPEEVLNKIEIKEDMIAADFGCGSGGFTFPLAKKLKKGFVYAVDIQELPLSAMRGRANMESISNIDFILGDIENKLDIQENSLDIVTIINVLFQIEDKKAVIGEALRLLKKGGKMIIVDWDKKAKMQLVEEKVSLDEIKEIAKDKGFAIEEEFKAGTHHCGVIFKKI
ncbi:MAG: class I SAM-dependent methyltransferase [Candidatus Pacebacteria bacterium]|nr:class I SAM-dependent methyltransferase [Candidatus Paceibacterota bacterium]MDD3072362.1 class I SAM-dependent methyltransferase [Candidatus Paceibacterota bacterium]MDD3728708.1 class I SAM-dependent methyltransferase [Candidatus Paceibacterota bacterium]MDD4201434.1 class I SAM-dependent methyltransferase [Candidatus Paceibacterota bacterium]MDD4466956.1 class I SAM-dependent methyltransferase [Candidatus Paceibacterota bacterium]